jgi:hypothetical protein
VTDKDLLDPIEQQLQGERASSLGEAGKRLEAALEELALGSTEERLDEAATAAWYYMIVRESLHLFDHKAAFAIYQVPNAVIARVGVIKRTAT